MRERDAFIKSHITIFNVETIEPERYFGKIDLSTMSHAIILEKKKEKEDTYSKNLK